MTWPPRRRHPRTAYTAVAVVLAVTLGACTTSAPSSTGDKGYITGDGVVTTIAPADRKPAPMLTGDRLGGGTVSLRDFDGQVVVVNVWASWCGPCREEADDLVEAAHQLPDVGFLGLNVRDQDASAEAFVRSRGIPYPSLVSQDGSAMLDFYGMLNLSSLPSTIVIDAQGKVAALVLGATTASTIAGLVDDLQQKT